MLNNTVLRWIADLFQAVYQMGNDIHIYEQDGAYVSLNAFLLAIFLTTVIVGALLNFARTFRNNNSGKGERVKRRKDEE